ncbi:uncharacterized protein EI90DRAFT_3062504 [Cantharellus anzutake]|uniref:uncharacterized protein n=1 Tax=Cantharellus anzutake TaxID=1750568 RepID=UPI0019051D08|nr:uncharacterized protein EI90DRAFT_3062504 [Cantharellus anzutake]KAF8329406.1 hypothetical protein EI90DRAFT_3062504 [Cantharellus anzutake]
MGTTDTSSSTSQIICPTPRRGCLVRTPSSDCVAKRCVKWCLKNEIHEVEQWDRSPCPVTPKLTYRDLLELKQLELDKVPQSPFRSLADLPVIGLPRVGVGLQPIFDRKHCDKAPTPTATPVPTPDRVDSPQIDDKPLSSPAYHIPLSPPDGLPTPDEPSLDGQKSAETGGTSTFPSKPPDKETCNHISQALNITSALLATPAPRKFSSPKKPTLQGFHFMPLLSLPETSSSSPPPPALPTPPPSISSCDGESELDDDAQTTTEDDSVSQMSDSARSDRGEDEEPTLTWTDGEIQAPQESNRTTLPKTDEHRSREFDVPSNTLSSMSQPQPSHPVRHYDPPAASSSVFHPTCANRFSSPQHRLGSTPYPPPRPSTMNHHRPYVATCARGPHLLQRPMTSCKPGGGMGLGSSSRGKV